READLQEGEARLHEHHQNRGDDHPHRVGGEVVGLDLLAEMSDLVGDYAEYSEIDDREIHASARPFRLGCSIERRHRQSMRRASRILRGEGTPGIGPEYRIWAGALIRVEKRSPEAAGIRR